MEQNGSRRPCAGAKDLWSRLDARCHKSFIAKRPGDCKIYDAEDAYQDAITKLMVEYGRVVPAEITDELCAYFFKMYKNRLLDICRMNKRACKRHTDAGETEDYGEFKAWLSGDRHDKRFVLLQQCILRLTASDRNFIELCLDPNLDMTLIAFKLGLKSAHAASTRKYKIINKMKLIAMQIWDEEVCKREKRQ
jgi:DNA-directed RNA polymerase specialized sigma24 family protein